jgi:hypothetical protein
MQIGQYQTPSGGDATYGGTGGSGPFGAGGIGNNVQGVVAAGGAYGAGGAGGVQGSPSLIDAGGLGGGGLMMLFWIEH